MAGSAEIRRYWDTDAATYDAAPNHNAPTPASRAAWAAALARLLPVTPARVLDCGAGTGFLSLIAARQGHHVTALDLSTGMLDKLRAKAAAEGVDIAVVQGAADEPPPGPFDVVMERHLVWTLEKPVQVLRRWREVAPEGRLLLVESAWGTADPLQAVAGRVRYWVKRAVGRPPAHHAKYSPELAQTLPLAGGVAPSTLVDSVVEAGWPDPFLERLRDIDWTETLHLTVAERLIGVSPWFVVSAG